jgi:hypothetical protein
MAEKKYNGEALYMQVYEVAWPGSGGLTNTQGVGDSRLLANMW